MARKLLPLILLTALTLCSARPGLSQTCGGQNVCTIKGAHGGTYYVVKPTDDSTVKPMKIFVFFHGHNGSGKSVLRNRRMIANLHRQGYLVVAPDGPQFRFNNRTTRGWAARKEAGEPRGRRDDIMFVENVLTTVAQRYQLEIADTVISGFSSGGSMAWYFSCYSKLPLGGIIAVAGGLRRPLPSNPSDSDKGSDAAVPPCPGGPRNVVHIHGFSDRQVPLEGRRIRSWHQGDVFEGLSVQRKTNGCRSRPDAVESKGTYWCRTWRRCSSGIPVQFCLHPGGHGMPKNWLSTGLTRLSLTARKQP